MPLRALLLAASLFAAPASLAQLPAAQPPTADIVEPVSERTRATAMAVNDASARIYRAVAASQDDADNLFLSPAGLMLAGTLLREGASGETLAEIDTALGYAAMEDATADIAQLSGEIASDTDTARLIISNAVFFDEGYTLKADYADRVKALDAKTAALPILSDPTSAAASLNAWTSETTRGLIAGFTTARDLVRVVTVLANTVYFKSVWETPFPEDATAPAAFAAPDGPVDVPTMQQFADLRWTDEDGLTVLHLPYKDGRYTMVLAMPGDGDVGALEARLDGTMIADMLADKPMPMGEWPGSRARTRLFLPKWEFEGTYSLNTPLQSLGMRRAFTSMSEVDRIVDRALMISKAVQGTKVIVDEEGTEAAATTMIYAVPVSAPPPPVELRIDRPFLYMIADARTGTVIFMGRVLDPTQESVDG